MDTTNHKVDGLETVAGMVTASVLARAVHFAAAGRSGTTDGMTGVLPAIQWSLGAAVLGTVGVFASETSLVVALGGVLATVGLVGLVGALVLGAAVADTLPPPVRAIPDDEASDGALVALADGLHVARVPLVFHGAPFGTRMTVIDTGEGLLVYSPVEATEARLASVRALGEVRWIVAPNPLHHLFVAAWTEAFPDAVLVAAPGLAARRPDLTVAVELTEGTDAPWPVEVVRAEAVHGHPFHVEIVLFHVPSATLVVSDLIENLGQDGGGFRPVQRALLRAVGMDRRPGPPTDWKWTVRDRPALAASVATVSGWAPARIVPAHGPRIDEDAQAVWDDAFAFAS